MAAIQRQHTIMLATRLRRLQLSPFVGQTAGLLALVCVWYMLAQATSAALLGVIPGPDAWLRDLTAHTLVAMLLLLMARSFARFAFATLTLFSAFAFANAMKIAILGAPIMPDDFASARNLLLLLEGWQLLGTAALAAVPIALLGWMIQWRSQRTWVILAITSVAVVQFAAHPAALLQHMDRQFGDWVWNQRGNFEMRGLPIHLVQETARSLSRSTTPPDEQRVAQVLAHLPDEPANPFVRVGSPSGAPRNVHIIVLESFWDPAPLHAARFSRDPLDPGFRKLWKATGHSRALSPVFGGYTANAEFEALCGFPVFDDAVFFEGRLRRDVPCLPRHLGEIGYRTHASHPNAASFWNRVHAYRRIGFAEYWSAHDFDMDDVNREFLSDTSLYRQVLERLGDQIDGPEPVLNYVLTYFGHLDYPLNALRPPVVTAPGGREYAEAYANTVYYKSRELMTFLATLRKRDPEGLIVIFGDHLPFLGMNHANYTDSGLLGEHRGLFNDEMFRTLVATPLIVIDGRRGPLELGDLPIYQLPALILDLLGDGRNSIMRMTAPPDPTIQIRPLPGMHLVIDNEAAHACRGEESDALACVGTDTWLAQIRLLERDIFSGHQHALRLQTPTRPLLNTADVQDAIELGLEETLQE